jgi:hypothetical protein
MEITTIKTDERIFLVHHNFNMGKKTLCNLADLEKVISASNSIQKIEHFLDYKFKRISKTDLKAMLESMKLNTDFLKLI